MKSPTKILTKGLQYLVGLFCIAEILAGGTAWAQAVMDPASVTGGRTRLAPYFAFSDVDYELGSGATRTLSRKVLGAELSHGLSREVDGIAIVGLGLDEEAEGIPRDGTGFSLGLGARGVVYRRQTVGVVLYGFFNWMRDQFKGSPGWKYTMQTYDLHAGGTISMALNGRVQPYIGLDLAALRDGSDEYEAGSLSAKGDVEKDDIFALKLGVNILAGGVMLRPEATLFGEQTFVFAAGFPM